MFIDRSSHQINFVRHSIKQQTIVQCILLINNYNQFIRHPTMATTLVAVPEELDGYGSIPDDEDLVVPFRQPLSRPPSSWKNKKVVLGLIGVTVAVVVAVFRATALMSGNMDASSAGPPATLLDQKLQHYDYVTITNKTPYEVLPQHSESWEYEGVNYYACASDFMYDGLPAGQTWSASSRGFCLVLHIYATLGYYNNKHGEEHWSWLTCTPYASSGTAYSIYYVVMNGDNHCCVLSSHEIDHGHVCPRV